MNYPSELMDYLPIKDIRNIVYDYLDNLRRDFDSAYEDDDNKIYDTCYCMMAWNYRECECLEYQEYMHYQRIVNQCPIYAMSSIHYDSNGKEFDHITYLSYNYDDIKSDCDDSNKRRSFYKYYYKMTRMSKIWELNNDSYNI